ncbi:Probable L-aspartate dehydrogenase [Listeria monocytogenes N53-1]|nr:Probable L-aspartate dehydrogenase [Listeria monocytogenes]CCQ24866.1 Probable L-aspartate dehydrogenase [Listeria monocytogenes N53-1]
MTLKVGIIGCGGIANGKHMPSLLKAEKAEMVAFCDNVLEKQQKNLVAKMQAYTQTM